MKKILSNKLLPVHLFLVLLFFTGKGMAQQEERLSEKFKDIAKPESTKGWIKFKEDAVKNPKTIFEDYKDAFELSANDKMIIKKIDKDKLGFNHFRFQQYYKNYRVLYGEYIVHQTNDGFVKSANGRLITGLDVGNTAVLPEKKALDVALHFMNAKKYLWQRSDMEKELKRQEKNVNATYYPKGELVYAPVKNDGSHMASDYRFAWYFKIYVAEGNTTSKNVYVDAINGKIIYHTDISMSCGNKTDLSGGDNLGSSSYNGPEGYSSCYNAKGYSSYNGTLYFKTTYFLGDSVKSLNGCQPTELYVYDCNGGGATNQFYKEDAGFFWKYERSAVQAQYGIAMTYKYFDSIHNRKSWDDEAGDMIAYNEANIPGLGLYNSCWGCNGNTVMLGYGDTDYYKVNDDWNTLDIMGHEFMHGITQSTATLDYNKESGALNESFSDIFGEMVESIAQGSCDYLVGKASTRTVGPYRSFIKPKKYGQPDTYLGTNWFNTTGCSPDTTNDNCGVHTNSGVQNHWFYLLSEGGNGVNDKGESYYVAPITYFKARYIAYRALVNYLNSDAKYIDARKASIEAAEDLFGSCSPEAISVADAWHAVGVESQSSQYIKNVCGSYPESGTFEQALSALTAANGCTVEITPGATVYFTARDRVILNPGFIAYNGSNFIAYTSACSGTLFKGMILQPAKDKTSISYNNDVYIRPDDQKKFATVLEGISVSPNPFVNSFIVSIDSKENQKAQIMLYNSVGTKVRELSSIVLVKGVNKISFETTNLSQGVYMLEINFGNSKTMKKLVKI